MMDGMDIMIDEIQGNVTGERGGKKHVSTAANPILMRLRLAALLVIGHKDYPDALSRLTNTQVSVFALFDAIKAKSDLVMKMPIEPRPRGESRYFAVRAKYGLPSRAPKGTLAGPLWGLSHAPTPSGGMAQGAASQGKTVLQEQQEAYIFYGLMVFTQRFKAMSQSIMGDGRKEYLEGIEEKSVNLRYGSREDLDIPKPSLYETLTGKPKRERGADRQ